MIERKFIKEKINDYKVQKYLLSIFKSSNYSHSNIQKTPLGEKITIYSSRPGLIIGRKGENIKKVINYLKNNFNMKTPQLDVQEIVNPNLNANIIAENIVSMLERNGVSRFKYIGHSMCKKVMDAGAIGVEVKISGRVPSKRTKTWKFIEGYLPKCGNPADEYVMKGFRIAMIKAGTVGVTVKILLPNTKMPDDISIQKVIKEDDSQIKEEKINEDLVRDESINEDLVRDESIIENKEKEVKE